MQKTIQVTLGNGRKRTILVKGRACERCGEVFYKRPNARFCSEYCQKKESNRRYKDRIRHGKKREALLNKNGFTCSECSKKGNRFQIIAHHEEFDSENHKRQILLCRSCHAKIHGLGQYWPTLEKECGVCGAKFTTHRWNAKYCSPPCRTIMDNERNRKYAKRVRLKQKPT